MQGSGMHYKEALGTAVSIIGWQLTFPLNVNQAAFKKESTSGNPIPASSSECTRSNSFLFSRLEKGVVQL